MLSASLLDVQPKRSIQQ